MSLSKSVFPYSRCVAVLASVLVSGGGHATVYSNYINESAWATNNSVFECRIEHSIPYFGDVVFRTRAGEASSFYIRGLSSRFQAGKAIINAREPVWVDEKQNKETIGVVPVKRGKRPMWLGSQMTEKMLAALSAGQEIELQRQTWYNGSEKPSAQVVVSNIGFQESYQSYLGCLSSLLPANYDQLKRTALLFPPGISEDLPSSLTRKLDQIVQLLRADKQLGKLYVDGHTSAPGNRAENLELSKIRAELVSQYLMSQGVPEDRLVIRWHGERYPVASNGSAAGRAKNRRVTVRLEKLEKELPPLASVAK